MESLASLTALLDHMPAMIAYWDSDLFNRFANHAYVDWFGVDPISLAGMHIRDLLGPTVFELNHPYMERALAGEEQFFERTLTDPEGHIRYAQATYTPYVVDGQTIGFFALVTDVSQLKRTQLELSERNDQLAAAIRARELLMATLTHDLRAPLGAIVGYTELLSDEILALSDESTHYLEVISRNSHDLLLMVNQLVEFGQIEGGGAHYTLEPVDVRAVMAATVSSLGPAAQAKGLTLTAVSGEPLHIQADAHALSRVLVNLTTNAIKFTPSGGVTLHAVAADGRGRIEVTDTGPGITPEDQRVIFNAFERGHANTTGKREGIGLGLHICAQLTNLTGGDISVRSDIGQGSTFIVSWPLAHPQSEVKPAARR